MLLPLSTIPRAPAVASCIIGLDHRDAATRENISRG